MRLLIPLLATLTPLLAVDVSDAFTRATAPGQRNGAVFVSLTNTGDQPVRFVQASCRAAAVTELHTHQRDEHGVLHMRPVEAITIPAHGSAHLVPGGDHLMLLDLREPLVEGHTLAVTLSFSDGTTRDVTVPVLAPDATSPTARPACCQ